MIPRLDIRFPLCRQLHYWWGKEYQPKQGEYLVNHARTGIVMALRAALPNGVRVGVVAYNCHTVANAVVNAGCVPVFVDVTDELKIDVDSVPVDLAAIVVTNLFGIRNEVETIRKRCPKAVVIVDNAHGYGLPVEGDFTVYSINQGKFPALGEGGILYANEGWRLKIDDLYKELPSYDKIAQVKLFFSMLINAIAYSHLCYWIVMKLKKNANPNVHQDVIMKKMASGIRRIYRAALPEIPVQIEQQRVNALKILDFGFKIDDLIVGENAFMAIVQTDNPEGVKQEYAKRGVETATHFKNSITWAREFGYKDGSCLKAEYFSEHLLMIPTYRAL